MTERKPFGIAKRHALADCRQAEVPDGEAVEADAAAEGDVAAAEAPGHLVDAETARVERYPAVDRLRASAAARNAAAARR